MVSCFEKPILLMVTCKMIKHSIIDQLGLFYKVTQGLEMKIVQSSDFAIEVQVPPLESVTPNEHKKIHTHCYIGENHSRNSVEYSGVFSDDTIR